MKPDSHEIQVSADEELLTFPASYAQQRIWLSEQFAPGGSAYHIPFLVSLTGELNLQVLQSSLQQLVDRHETLRTTFRLVETELFQDVHDTLDFELEVHEVESLPAEQRETAWQMLLQASVRQPFDLERGPLFRAQVVRIDAHSHVMQLVLHHIISDGWSMGLLMNELTTIYSAELAGVEPQLPELLLQYGDFSEAQREWVAQGQFNKQKAYWLNQLQGPLPKLQLPSPHRGVPSSAGALFEFQVPPALVQSLKDRSRASGTTLFMTLLAGWNALLFRYTGQTDLLVGTPIAGRNRHEIEPLIGCFLNTLLLRTQLDASMSFADLLAVVRTTCLSAYDHQDLPIEAVLDELETTSTHKGEAPFQVLFMLQNTPPAALQLGEAVATMLPVETGGAKFDLTLSFLETEDVFHGTLEYKKDRFDEATIARMCEHLLQLLAGALATPEKALLDLPLLTDEEHSLLTTWNATAHEAPLDRCLHDLFAEQAAKTPDHVALFHEGRSITYRELDERSNQLARHLQKRGVTRGSRVGLCLERSFAQITALLAIFKAGAAYVPLDVTYPAQRLSYIFRDSGATLLLTASHLLGLFPVDSETHILQLDHLDETLAAESTEALALEQSSEQLAFLLYTSGSTGTPKGVLSTHRGAMNRLCWMWGVYPFTADEVGCHKTTLNFIDSVWEIFGPLLQGIPAVIVPETMAKEPDALLDLIHAHRVSRLVVVPSFMKMLLTVEQDHALNLQSVRYWLSSGEALTPELARQVLAVAPQSTLLNLYGSTEVYDATCQEVTVDTPLAERIPLGRPTWNTKIYVLDRHLRPLPVGMPGEIYIEGASLALGYHNLPEQTQEAFIPSPFATQPGTMLYRIGDLGRWLPDGTLDYLGRVNHLVKVRGFRVELGEIEAVLRQRADIREVVVHTYQEPAGDLSLVAYIVPRDKAPSVQGLRNELGELLPDYMVPSYFEFLTALPQTPNGKVDRQALPAPSQPISTRYTAPQSPIEELIAGIWQELLPVERISVDDNFFELGGHSLTATKLMTRLYSTFRVRMPLHKMFEEPTVRALATFIEQKRGQGKQPELPPIQKRTETTPAPLSFAQERLWFLQQMDKTSTAYHIAGTIRLTGPFDVSALERAFTEIVRRHEVLRTTYATVDGQPVQLVQPPAPVEIVCDTLPTLSEAEQATAIVRWAETEAARPFDLEQDLMLRIRMLHVAPEHAILQLTCHHIAADGWSLEVLSQELIELYEAAVKGTPFALPELPLQLTDIAAWQKDTLQGETLEQLLSYWKQKLGLNPPVLQLPTDRPRPAVLTSNGALHKFRLSAELTTQLHELSRRSGATLYMTLLSAWNVLLARYSGQNEILVGTAISGRNHAEMERLIGCFVNTLVLRTDLSEDLTFQSLLEQVRTNALDAFSHQEVPFDKLVNELQIERNLSYTPLYQVMFVLQNANETDYHLHDVRMEAVPLEQRSAKCDLSLAFGSLNDHLEGNLEYNCDLFDKRTIERMSAHLVTLLEAIVADPKRSISSYPLLSEAERTQLLVDWNATDAEYPSDACLHQIFEAQALRTPEAIAVVYGEQQICYGELNRRANQLAHRLIRAGVGADVLVGICMERSVEMIVAVFGILKAGGAYVPLDATYPKDRLAFLMEDSQTPVVLTQERLLEKLPTTREVAHQAEVICLEPGLHVLDGESETSPLVEMTPDQLAYVIYTSGTTGQPKGALLPHRGVVNLLTDFNNRKPVLPGAGCAAWSNFGFDLSVMELFGALLFGGRLHVLPDELRADSAGYFAWLTAGEIRYAYLPPFFLKELIEHLRGEAGERPLHLQRIMVGVEPIQETLLAELYSLLPDVTIINAYGPTEASICTTLYTVDSARVQERNTPIGKPVQNTKVYLLDSQLQPVPIGVAGELYTGGVHVGRGYWNRPELTAEKFIPSPFVTGDRLYKTGDMARYLPDGNIEYIARRDSQVKLRGFRIELGEIEAVLRQHPHVSEAVVLLEGDATEKRLIAYALPREGLALTTEELRAHLKAILPVHYLPSAYVLLEQLPLTPNGKIDRKALLALAAPLLAEREYVAPRTPYEQQMTTIWSRLLRVEQVGALDNFFELGGHSLLATQLISQIRQTWQVELPLRTVFESPTVADMSDWVQQASHEPQAESMPTIETVNRSQPLDLSFAQQRLWLLEQLEPGNAAYHMPAAFRLRGALNDAALVDSLSEIIRRHEVLRTTYHSQDGRPVQVIEPARPFHLPVHDLRTFPAAEQTREIGHQMERFATQPFDLSQAPLVRGALLQLDEAEHALLLNIHHIAADGWSMGLFAQEMATLYAAFTTGRPSPLAELAIQYADFAAWQRHWLAGDKMEQQLSYWKQQLADAPPLTLFPQEPARSEHQEAAPQGAKQTVVLPAALTESLRKLSRSVNGTLFMTLLAGFQTLLYRHTKQEDLVIGTPIAGRTQAEVETLIGLFLNTLALRTQVSEQLPFHELLHRVRETTLGAYAHQEVPFEKLVEELQPERSLRQTPLFQILFNGVNIPDTELELNGLTLSDLTSDSIQAKYPLTVYVEEPGADVQIRFVYQRDVYSDAYIAELLAQYVVLLEQVAADPQRPLGAYHLLTAASRSLLPDPTLALPERPLALLDELFAQQVAQHPEQIALQQGANKLTYADLYQRSTVIAQSLLANGLVRGETVAVQGARCIGTIAAMLGVLRSGGQLLTLDPNLPENRRQLMLEVGRTAYLLQVGAHTKQEAAQTDMLDLKRIWQVEPQTGALLTPATEATEATDVTAWTTLELPPLRGDDVAYLFFTSGTTGTPKGVQGLHKGLAHFLSWQRDTFTITTNDRFAQMTGLSFDVVLRDIFTPLISGATLCLPDQPDLLVPEQIVAWLGAERITGMHTVPAIAEHLLSAGERTAPLPHLRLTFFAGEPLQDRLVRRWRTHFPQVEVVNLYGPTETTLAKCYYRVPNDLLAGVQPVGRPLPDTQALVLTAENALCGRGEIGEIVIRTPYRTAGYVNTPEEMYRFFANPFREQAEDLLYRTGDVGRYALDGTLEIVGRADDQVKIRGVRVEPDETATLLAQHPAVESCVVLAKRDDNGTYFLAAYVVPKPDGTTSPAELRSYLAKGVADVMVPSAYVMLDALPVTANGKVDRRALPTPERLQRGADRPYLAPRNLVEEVIASVFAEVLELEPISVDANFFEMGGHSLLVMQVTSLLADTLQLDFSMRLLFEEPTVQGLAAHLLADPDTREHVEKVAELWKMLTELSDEELDENWEELHGQEEEE